eukprot:CFRG1426T1
MSILRMATRFSRHQVRPSTSKQPLRPASSPKNYQPLLTLVQLYSDEIPKEFDARDMCCMSGCAHCVLDDIYEDALKAEEEGKPMEAMDPTIKAFLEMEKKLKEKTKLSGTEAIAARMSDYWHSDSYLC